MIRHRKCYKTNLKGCGVKVNIFNEIIVVTNNHYKRKIFVLIVGNHYQWRKCNCGYEYININDWKCS